MANQQTTSGRVLEQARQWAACDPDIQTRNELSALIATADNPLKPEESRTAVEELQGRFNGVLHFGTAGLRAPMGAGPARMNQIVVRQATAGLANYAINKLDSLQSNLSRSDYRCISDPVAVIGYDARHKSYDFATDTAAIFSAMGFIAYLMPRPVPTPVTAYACQALNAEVAVMITASHNPAYDNGYKVYLSGRLTDEHGRGAQIVSPTDKEIAAEIAAVDPLTGRHTMPALESRNWILINDSLLDDYIHRVQSLAAPAAEKLNIVLTPTHGVGGTIALKVLSKTCHIHPVAEQFKPDPDFPTLTFPNPEEPDAMDLAFKLAAHRTQQSIYPSSASDNSHRGPIDCVIALDPDADRCAVGVISRAALASGKPATQQRQWVRLSGDEVGILLAQHIVSKLRSNPRPYQGVKEPYVLSNSLVSSPLLERLAVSNSMKFCATLSGSKWISRVPGLVYGFEEALGYCADPRAVRDKDGISAAMLMTEFIADLKSQGKTVWDVLDDLALRYGLYATTQHSVRVEKIADRDRMLTHLIKNPPQKLLDSDIIESVSLEDGYHGLPPARGVVFRSKDGSRCVVRPSGTEPKLKFYFLVVYHPRNCSELAEAHQRAEEKLVHMEQEIFQLQVPFL